jgi:hypothetical protein
MQFAVGSSYAVAVLFALATCHYHAQRAGQGEQLRAGACSCVELHGAPPKACEWPETVKLGMELSRGVVASKA